MESERVRARYQPLTSLGMDRKRCCLWRTRRSEGRMGVVQVWGMVGLEGWGWVTSLVGFSSP